ncbi:MAG TPA: NPCBM/NEW2 domain-containing protein [Pirellulales bacterium]|nr:NPCBM/NEW2 domain-containing protein [Pirellulales bacterium]
MPTAVPVDGAPFEARLRTVDADWRLTFAGPAATAAPKQMPAADLCWWGRWAEPHGQTQVLLVDGSLIVADIADIDKQRALLDWSSGGSVKLPLEIIAGIVFHPPADPQSGDALLAKLPTAGAGGDRLLLVNGDAISGELLSLTDDVVRIRTAAGELKVRTAKIAALAMNSALAAKPHPTSARAWLGLSDGSRLLVSATTFDDVKAHVSLASAPANAPPLELSADDICALQPLGGRCVYLSDLKPASYQYIPLLDLKWPWHADRNVLGTQLRAGGQLFLKGLGMHSASRLTYVLDKPFREFAAETAIDDQTAGHGSALFRVYTDDGSGHWTLKYDGPIVRGGTASQSIKVDLAGAKRLSLLVDFADQGDIQAHADWLNARLLK